MGLRKRIKGTLGRIFPEEGFGLLAKLTVRLGELPDVPRNPIRVRLYRQTVERLARAGVLFTASEVAGLPEDELHAWVLAHEEAEASPDAGVTQQDDQDFDARVWAAVDAQHAAEVAIGGR